MTAARPNRAMAVVVIVLLCVLLAVLGYGVVAHSDSTTIDQAVAAGRRPPAPALALPGLDGGRSTTLASLRGRVVVLNFWASWCLPCREEAPVLERWQRKMRGHAGTVVGVDALDVASDARAFVAREHLTYPILRDGGGATRGAFGTRGYPETFVLDRSGRVAALQRGPVDDAFLRRNVGPLLEEPA